MTKLTPNVLHWGWPKAAEAGEVGRGAWERVEPGGVKGEK